MPIHNAELMLVSHGLTRWNLQNKIQGHVDTPLCAQGYHMAESLARSLANTSLDIIYSSDLRRALQTAAPVARAKDLRLNPDSRLREGRARGQEVTEEYPLLPFECDTETEDQVLQRIFAAITDIAEKNLGKKILVVSHCGAIELFIRQVLRQSAQTNLCFKNTRTAINRILYYNGRWKCLQLDDDEHLRGLGID